MSSPRKPIRHPVLSHRKKSTARFSKIMLIFNPQSGQGLFPPFFQQLLGIQKNTFTPPAPHKTLLQKIQTLLAAQRLYPETIVSNSSAEATRVAARCAQEHYDLVIAVGGDGTINAVVNGLAGSKTPLAVIPMGTINIYTLQMKIPNDLEKACAIIARGQIQSMDLGKMNQHYFACMAGIGFDAFVIKGTDSNFKKTFGVFALAVSAFFGFFLYPFTYMRIQLDHHNPIHKGYFMIVGNMKYYGGKLVLLPKAKTNDGYLDICLFKKRGFFNFIGYIWGLRQGELSKYLDVEYFQCKHIQVKKRKQFIHLDGEYFGKTKVSIQVVPNALRVIV